jgi:membrane protease YdiL (CAAX protease family)
MEESKPLKGKRLYRLTIFAVFFICGLSIFLFGFNFISTFPSNSSTLYRIIISVFFLALTVFAYFMKPLRNYWRVSLAFFIASLGMLLNWVITDLPVRFLYDSITITEGRWMLDKLSQFIAIVIPILVLTLALSDKLSSLYIQKGKYKLWVIIGLSTFVFFVALGLILALQKSSLQKIISILPWLFAFSALNALMEELWFRGLFLKKFEPFLGNHLSIFLTSLIFSIPHIFARYLSGIGMSLVFFLVVFSLGMASGYIIYKTKSIWGAVIFHMGYDLFYALVFGFGSVK